VGPHVDGHALAQRLREAQRHGRPGGGGRKAGVTGQMSAQGQCEVPLSGHAVQQVLCIHTWLGMLPA
jgi:hypothetical protein